MIWLLVVAIMAAVLLVLGAPYVPTHHSDLDQIFAELGVAGNKTFADLGSGDGRVLKRARAAGFRAVGFELNPLLWLASKLRLGRSAEVYFKPWQQADLSNMDVLYIFSTSWHMRSSSVKQLPETAIIIVYGPQPSALAGRESQACGSAIIYQPVARI